MKRRQTRKQRKSRRNKKQRRLFSRRRYKGGSRVTTDHRGGANLPVPNGSVVAVELDPKDRYGVPILVSKEIYEDEVLED
jgi:hypothetical protein